MSGDVFMLQNTEYMGCHSVYLSLDVVVSARELLVLSLVDTDPLYVNAIHTEQMSFWFCFAK